MHRFAVLFIKAVVNIYIARSFDKIDFGRSLSPVENSYLAVIILDVITHIERDLLNHYFVRVLNSKNLVLRVGLYLRVFSEIAYVIDFPYFINTPPEYFSLLL